MEASHKDTIPLVIPKIGSPSRLHEPTDLDDEESDGPPSSILYEHPHPSPSPIATNPGYWAQKFKTLISPDSGQDQKGSSEDDLAVLHSSVTEPPLALSTLATTLDDGSPHSNQAVASNSSIVTNSNIPSTGYPDAAGHVLRGGFPSVPVLSNLLKTDGEFASRFNRTYPPRKEELDEGIRSNSELPHLKSYRAGQLGLSRLMDDYTETGTAFESTLAHEHNKRAHLTKTIAMKKKEISSLEAQIAKRRGNISRSQLLAQNTLRRRTSLALQSEVRDMAGEIQISRAASEGAIAGYFDTRRDEKERTLSRDQIATLKDSGFLCGHVPTAPSAERINKLSSSSITTVPTISLRQASPLTVEVGSEARKAFQEAYTHWQPTSPSLDSKLDTSKPLEFSASRLSTRHRDLIPKWFHFFVKYEIVVFASVTPEERFRELLNIMSWLEQESQQRAIYPQKKWDKNWHEPNPLWDTGARQRSGG